MAPQRITSDRTPAPWRTLRRWLPAVLAAGLGAAAMAQTPPAQPPATEQPMPPAQPKPDAAKPEKLYEVKFDKTEWSQVFEWLEKESGLLYLSKDRPTGTISLRPTKKYTLGELIDLLNEVLERDNFLILRKNQSFSTVPADVKINKAWIQTVTPEELAKRGKTEVVQMIVPLVTLNAEEILLQVKKSLSQFGEVSTFGTDKLLLLDKADNVRLVLKVIEDTIKDKNDTHTHTCKFKRASEVANSLRTLLKEDAAPAQVNPYQQYYGGGFDGGGGRYDPRSSRQPEPAKRFAAIAITVDDAQNSLTITGPVAKVLGAKELLKDLDKGDKPRPAPGQPEWMTYSVATGTAEALAKQLLAKPEYVGSNIAAMAKGTDQVMVYAYQADHLDITKFLTTPETKSSLETKAIIVNLNTEELTSLATNVKAAVGTGFIADVKLDGEPGLIVTGTPEQVRTAETYIYGSTGQAPGGVTGSEKYRTLTIDRGNAAALAEAIAEMGRKMGKNIEVRDPNRPQLPPRPQPQPQPQPMQPGGQPGSPQARFGTLGSGNGQVLRASATAQLVDPAQKPDVTLTIVGNKLVITGDDPANVQLMYDLLSLYTRGDKATERYEVLRLKNVSAEEAAKVINEIFNVAPQQQQQQQGGGRGGRGGGGGFNPLTFIAGLAGGGASAPTDPSAGRVKVVAEKSSNSLIIVKASELDVLTIKDLLKKAIDSDLEPEGGVSKRWIIPLKHADASAMVVTIKNVYANYTTASGGGGGGGSRGRGGFNPFAAMQGGGGGEATKPALNIDYDIATNQVIVDCSEPLYQDIKALCEQLDTDTKASEYITETVQVTGIAPSQVQQFIEALQGKAPTTTPITGGFGNTQGGFGGGFGGGTGGFGGGGRGGFGGGTTGGFGGFGGGGRGGFGGGGTGGFGGGGRGGFGGGTSGFGGGGRGGFGGGGGGTRGGGGGRGGNRNRSDRQISSYLDGGGGQRPFDYAGMDAPSTSLLFDPEVDLLPGYDYPIYDHGPRVSDVVPQVFDVPTRGTITFSRMSVADDAPAMRTLDVMQVQAALPGQPNPMPMQPGQPNPMPMQPGGAKPLVLESVDPDTEVISNDQLGVLVIRGKSQEEIDRIKRVIEAFLKLGVAKDVTVAIEIVELKKADATVVVNEIQQLYSRLVVGPGSRSFPSTQPRTGGGFGGQQAQAQTTGGNIILFPLARRNAILVAVPTSSLETVKKDIEMFDTGTADSLLPVRYVLKRASATIVQQQILNLFSNRFPNGTSDKIRVTVDTANNAVLVQAGPADQEDISQLIQLIDQDLQGATNTVKVFRLKNAFADELAQVINNTLAANIYNPQASAASSGGTGTGVGGGGVGGGGGIAQGPLGSTGGGGGQLGGGGLGGGGLGTLTGTVTTYTTKTTALRFNPETGTFVESGLLEDVHITPDIRINALIVTAPDKTMKLIEALINELDGVSAAKSFVNIFQLKKADATQVQSVLLQLFSRTNQAGGLGGGGLGGIGGVGGLGTAQGTTRPLLTLTGDPSDGASLIDLRLTADTRTNSLIVAGSQNDLDLVRAVIAKLEDSSAPQFVTEVVKLRNAAAADVANALSTFISQQVTQAGQVQPAASVTVLQRQVLVTPEPITNQLLISATPQMMPDILRLLQAVDAAPPQVYIDVLIAEVRLNNTEEFGVEVGLQSNVLFARGGAQVGGAPGTPGYNFNTTDPLPNAANVNPGLVGFQGLGNLGVGRVGTQGVGGLVLSAASDSFSLLIRALKAQGRVDVLSRPSLTLTDNQTGFFQVGQQFPLIQGTTLVAGGLSQQNIQYASIGIVLRVTPRIGPDNSVLMRVEPQVSDASPTNVQIQPGVFAFAINTQTVETTVLAGDGETVVLGGLIRKSDTKTENKVPILGDLPLIGAGFRFRSQQQERREIVFIMTPRVMRSPADMRRIFADEARKMSWSIKDVANVTGVDPDTIRGNAADPSCNVDGIVGSAPSYLPVSPGSSVAPYYSNPASTVFPPATPVQPKYGPPPVVQPPYPPTPGWPAAPQQPPVYAQPPAAEGTNTVGPATGYPAPQYQYPTTPNTPGVPASAPPQQPPPAYHPAAYQQQQPQPQPQRQPISAPVQQLPPTGAPPR